MEAISGCTQMGPVKKKQIAINVYVFSGTFFDDFQLDKRKLLLGRWIHVCRVLCIRANTQHRILNYLTFWKCPFQ